jgi:23S rRNA (cytosine1962-C5)-methyltransferase
VWRDAIASGKASTGAEVQLVDEQGVLLGHGVADPDSPIAARVWTAGHDPIDDALVRARASGAVALRRAVFSDGQTDAYRLIHGEGDRMPGLVVDRYGDVGVLQVDGDGAGALLHRHEAPFIDALKGAGLRVLVRRSKARGGSRTTEVIFGAAPPATVVVREHGVPFVVDLERGQKTGTFLDQRENRRRVAALAAGKTMLNLFSYAGGFSLHAALRGAHVTSVDVAAGAHATAQASFRAAGVDPKGHPFVTADAFAFLADAKKAGKRWEIVVSDPPSFAPNEKSVKRALSAYRALHRACADVLAPGGVLCAASCSSHVGAAAFLDTLDDAALGRADLRLLELHGPPADHPTLPAWPEGRYLKLAVLG